MNVRNVFTLVGAILFGLFAGNTANAAGKYMISLTPKHIDTNEVTVEISTDIPGSIDVMLGLGLEGQAPNDVFIGTNKRVKVKNGQAVATVGKEGLPSGKYILKVSYYPKWGPQDAIAKSAGADSNIQAQQIVTLVGYGVSAADTRDKLHGQRWVMKNVYGGTAWDMATWTKKFGASSPVEITGLNPNVIKAYYFERIDITVFVNELKDEVFYWRLGRQSE